MSEESNGRGIAPAGIWAVVLAVIVVFGCVVGLGLVYGIEDSKANRAQAKAAVEQAEASAKAAEARAEVDKVAIRADAEIQKQVDRLAHELAVMRQQQENWEHTYSLALLAVSHLDEEELSDLEAQLSREEAHPPLWALILIGSLVLVLAGWAMVRDIRCRYRDLLE